MPITIPELGSKLLQDKLVESGLFVVNNTKGYPHCIGDMHGSNKDLCSGVIVFTSRIRRILRKLSRLETDLAAFTRWIFKVYYEASPERMFLYYLTLEALADYLDLEFSVTLIPVTRSPFGALFYKAELQVTEKAP